MAFRCNWQFAWIPDENYALHRPAFSSSQERRDGVPSAAVDGNPDPDQLGGGSCAVTDDELNPWWAVDLQRPRRVTSVEIINRSRYGTNVSFAFHVIGTIEN